MNRNMVAVFGFMLAAAATICFYFVINHGGDAGQSAGVVPASSTATVTIEVPTQAPTETATIQVADKTETPVTLEETDTPTATETAAETAAATKTATAEPTEQPTQVPTQVPTQTPTPETGLAGGWTLTNGDTNHSLTGDEAVLILAFNGTDQPTYLSPDENGKVDYSRTAVPKMDDQCGGLLGVVPLNGASFKLTIMPFRLDGTKLVLLDPTASACKVKDSGTILVSDHADDHTDKGEVLRFGCGKDCARMVLMVMGNVGPGKSASCGTAKTTFTAKSDTQYARTYRGKNGWSIGDTPVGPGYDGLGKVRTCKVDNTTWYVDTYGDIIWVTGKIAPAPTSAPITSSNGAVSSGNNTGASDQGAGQPPADQGDTNVVVIVPGNGEPSTTSDQGSGDCPDCNPVEVPPTPTAEAQVGVDLTPTPIH